MQYHQGMGLISSYVEVPLVPQLAAAHSSAADVMQLAALGRPAQPQPTTRLSSSASVWGQSCHAQV
jgi:hypothetical protein